MSEAAHADTGRAEMERNLVEAFRTTHSGRGYSMTQRHRGAGDGEPAT